MGILDTLNNFTEKINKAADKITNSNQQIIASSGLDGLGIVNKDNASATLTSMSIPLTKVDNDTRKLSVNMERFNSKHDYIMNVTNWFNNIQFGQMNTEIDCIKIQFINTIYAIYPCRNSIDLDELIAKGVFLSRDINTIGIVLGYFNYTDIQKQTLNNLNLQLIGIEGIIEINNAIDLADKGLPYISLDKTKFIHIISKFVHDKYYKKGAYNNILTQTETDMSNSINSFSDRVQEVGKELIEDIKETTKSTRVSLDKPDTQEIHKVSLNKKEELSNEKTKISLKK